MQQVCMVFAGRRGLDDYQTRQSILRIPEVSRKLKSVQNLMDHMTEQGQSVDILSHILSTDEEFSSAPQLRSLCAAAVQLGLFERYIRFHSRPKFLIGCIGASSAVKVCGGDANLEEFLMTSELLNQDSLESSSTQLSGQSLEEYGLYEWDADQGCYQAVQTQSKDIAKILAALSMDNQIQQYVHIGPCFEFRWNDFARNEIEQISSLSSIEMDPILNSFWKSA